MHRFFTIHSFTKFDHMVICMTCVLLASKVEEVECVSIRNVINHSFLFSYKKKLSKQVIKKFKPRKLQLQKSTISLLSQEMTRVKEDLRIHENILMATLGFDFRVSIPHIFILKYSKLLKATRQFEMSALNAATNSLLWTIMCLEYSPLFVACASMQVASQLENFMLPHKLPDGQCWYRVIDPTLTLELLNKITYELFEICKKYGMGRREDTFTPSPCLHTNFHRSNVEIKKPEKSKKRHRKISEPTNDYLPGTSNSDGPSETPAYFSFDPVLEKSDDNDKFPHKNSISGSDKNSKMKKFETELILEQDNQNEVLGQPRKTSRTVGRKELTCCPYYVQKILSSPDRRKHPHTQYYGRQVATEPFSPIKAGPPCTPMEKNHVEYGLCISTYDQRKSFFKLHKFYYHGIN